jgi:hypothetical protein
MAKCPVCGEKLFMHDDGSTIACQNDINCDWVASCSEHALGPLADWARGVARKINWTAQAILDDMPDPPKE